MEIKKKLIFPGEKEINELAKDVGLPFSQTAILYNRGFKTVDAIDNFLSFSEHDLRNPLEMQDAKNAAEIICKAIADNKHIVLYSDYDADGWGAAVVGYEMLSRLGANVNVYTNVREQGYGMCVSGVDEIVSKYPDVKLIVTADNGIVAYAGIDHAVEQGIDVVVTDHHQPAADGKLPNALASVNPHRADDKYRCKYLCGAAVLWKVLSICYYMQGISSKEADAQLDVVALSTVADVVPLLDENRIIVKKGLKMITAEARPQWTIFKKAFASAFAPIIEVDTETVGFSFGPGINAMSRMRGTIKLPINLFTMNMGEDDMIVLVDEMVKVNEERKAVTKSCEEAAISIVENYMLYKNKAIVVYAEELYEGVVGLVAGRIRETYNRPTIVLTKTESGDYRGSGRSVGGFHAKDVLDEIAAENPGMILGHGGHALACGLTVAGNKVKEFTEKLLEKAEKMLPDENVKNILVDVAYNDSHKNEITEKLVSEIKELAPYGSSFEQANIVLQKCVPNEVRLIGKIQQHISFVFDTFTLTSWYGAKRLRKDSTGAVDLAIKNVSAVGRIRKDDYGVQIIADCFDFEIEY